MGYSLFIRIIPTEGLLSGQQEHVDLSILAELCLSVKQIHPKEGAIHGDGPMQWMIAGLDHDESVWGLIALVCLEPTGFLTRLI